MGLKWHGKKVQKAMRQDMEKRLAVAAITWVNYTQQKLNEKVNRDGKTPSRSGEPYPAMVTSHLRRSIDWERGRKLSVRVGTNVVYGKYLQFKSPSKGGRPWMTTANREMQGKIRQILSRKFRG